MRLLTVLIAISLGIGCKRVGSPSAPRSVDETQTSDASQGADASPASTCPAVPAPAADAGGALSLADGSSCYCPMVTVRCSGPLTANAGANCNQAACELRLSASMCKQLSYTEGQRLSPASLDGSDYPPYHTVSEIYNYCAVFHELRHACDDPSQLKSCETEVIAYNASLSCLNAFYGNLGCDAPGKWNTTECLTLKADIQLHQIGREINQCKCNRAKSEYQCYQDCKRAHPLAEEECEKTGQIYFPN